MKTMVNGLFKENPVLVLLLGLCSTLAITTTLENAYIMGSCVLFVLICSEVLVALIKNIVPDNVRIPVYILIIGTFVTIIEILLSKFLPKVHEVLSIYIPLIIVNCIVLGRCLSIASKKSVAYSFLDAFGVGLGYTLALILIAFIRELLGSGTITLIDSLSSLVGFKLIIEVFDKAYLPQFLVGPAGAFLVVGFLLALINFLKDRKVRK